MKRPPKTHHLKINPIFYDAVLNGSKPFEVRRDDRDYRVGDTLMIQQWDGAIWFGAPLMVRVTYKLDGGQYGIEQGYCILGIRYE